MSLTIENIKELKNVSATASAYTITPEELKTFDYKLDAPADSVVTKHIITPEIKEQLQYTADEIGIKPYYPSLLKDNNTAIKKAQLHLIDLMKYYEGDPYYYYEAVTLPYKDAYGTYTNGFGELTDKLRSQETAYKNLCKNLKSYSKEVKRVIDKKVGKKTYENLPSSIKEGLIDLNYNKGLNKISTNKELLNALKNKDYSKVIANLAYIYSGKSNADKVESPGLYRRSLNRMILASRDLKGKEIAEAKEVIKNTYKKALACHKKNKVNTSELDKIYEQFTKGSISSEPVSAESWKFTADKTFKGKGVWAVAQAIYSSYKDPEISFREFYEEFKRINRNPESFAIGAQFNVPYLNDIKSKSVVASASVEKAGDKIVELNDEQEVDKPEDKQNISEQQKTEKKGFWSKLWDGIKNCIKAIGKFFSGLFTSCSRKEDEIEPEDYKGDISDFKGLLNHPDTRIEQDGEFQIITYDYEVKKGDGIWRLARTFGTTEDIICKNNDIQDKDKIQIGQKIKIQKLGYKINKGDNLFQIARKFGLSVEILKDLNDIVDVDKIKAGDMLEIPGYIYTVQPKDTLYKISKQVGVNLSDLKKINGLESDSIIPGQKIKVVYNDSDYAISDDKKKVVYDEKTNEITEIVDMRGTANLENRELLKQKRKVNGKVAATRAVFSPTASGELSGKTIIVNAGHGYSQAGTDVGTEGQKGLEDEWLINYDNAIRLKNRLCAKGAKVIFLQGHVNLIGQELTKKNNKADMFISVHVNNQDKKHWCKGKPPEDRTQVYFTGKAKNSKKLAGCMTELFKTKTDQKCAQDKTANYFVLKKAENNMHIPAVLWEVAFMCSKKGQERMSSPATMNQYSDIMTQSVVQYFKDLG